MNILEGFSKIDDLVELICTKYNYSIRVPRFLLQEFEEDNIFNGLDSSITSEADCQVCDGNMT